MSEREEKLKAYYDKCDGHDYQPTGWVVGGEQSCHECTKCGATIHDLENPKYCYINHPFQKVPQL